jgi:pyruvate ferredoxin oxidoreductase delta subunit
MNKFDDKMFLPVIDAKKCTQCTLCVVFCPEDAIGMLGKSGFPKVEYGKCTGCLLCLRECPYNAISEEKA